MSPLEGSVAEHLALVDVVDRLLDRGVVLVGQTTLSVADVDLVYVGLNLLVSSVETLERGEAERGSRGVGEGAAPRSPGGRGGGGEGKSDAETRGRRDAERRRAIQEQESRGEVTPPLPHSPSPPLQAPPLPLQENRPEQGLARLVLALVELLRQVLERQAMRRAEGGGLSDEQIERMGVALMELERKMAELREMFGLSEEDLNVDLGPLGRLLE